MAIHVRLKRQQLGRDVQNLGRYSPRTYLSLVEDRGWTPEQAMGWLADVVPDMIFAKP